MSIFKQQHKARNGETRESAKWYYGFRDHKDLERRIAGFTDRRLTERLGENIDDLVALRKLGKPPTNALADWLEQLSPKFKAKLAEFGLLDARSLCQSEPLAAHLDEFHAMMLAKGGTREHADTLKARIRNTLSGCRFVFFGDIKSSTVLRYLAKLREPIKQGDKLKPGLSIQTSNFYLKSFQQFCRWMVDDRRANENPVSGLKGGNVKLDRRHDRRGLSPDELGRLLTTTLTRPVLRKLSGRARVMLYRMAMETGLRRKELRSLTPAAFDFDSPEPTVFVTASNSKNRRETFQPIRRELVEELRQWFVEAGFQPDQPLWP